MFDDETIVNPMDAVLLHDDMEAMKAAFGYLDPRERKVIELRFGLDGDDPKTLDECTKVFNRTRERIRQVQTRAILKLRACFMLQSYGEEEIDYSHVYSINEACILNAGYSVSRKTSPTNRDNELIVKAANVLCKNMFHHSFEQAIRTFTEHNKYIFIAHINHNLFISGSKIAMYRQFVRHYFNYYSKRKRK